MSINPTLNLKRPRSTSQPPSPSGSSPKRAASEDDFADTSDTGASELPTSISAISHLAPNSHMAPTAGSSPLRQGTDTDDATWVKRTEDVHLTGDGADGSAPWSEVDEDEQQTLKDQYDALLNAVSPPFKEWERYYLIPANILNTLKTLAYDPDSKDATSTSMPRLDLTPLIKDTEGEKVLAIDNETGPNGSASLTRKAIEETLWSVKENLEENVDFMFISSQGWKSILEWYGPYEGPSLPRYCQPGERIQMVPPVYTIYLVDKADGPQHPSEEAEKASIKPLRVSCPSAAPLPLFTSLLTTLISSQVSSDAIFRFWTIDTGSTSDNSTLPALASMRLSPKLLPSLSGSLLATDSNIQCGEAGLENGDAVVVEVGKNLPFGKAWVVDVNAAGKAVERPIGITVPTAPAPLFSTPAFFGGNGSSSMTSTSSEFGMQTRSQARKEPRKGKGLVGLVNLGNTCFMNSAVQCLSNTPELNEYFMSGVYRNELNPDNPLGMNGEIANSFGETIENLWAPASVHASYAPRRLKWKTSHFAPQFAGYGQHDTQEFIAFLLDGLHEDLNRIKKKPYIEKPDWKPGGGDKELALLGKECWEGYKKRNDSVIVDLFQGQLKSTLVCPECHKESITLDPFMYLTVPLPIAQTRVFKCLFVPLDPASPQVKIKLLIPQNASFGQIKDKIATLVNGKGANMVAFDLWKSAVYTWYADADHNSEAKDSDVAVFYELPVPAVSSRKVVGIPATEPTITVPVYTVRTHESTRNYGRNEPDAALQPFFITLTKTEATDPVAVREAITKGYSRWVREDMRDELRVPSGSGKAARALPVDEDEPVTEIHLDGDDTRVVEIPPRSVEDDSSSSTLLSSPQVQRTASFASISDVASIKSSKSGRLVPRNDLFKVHVADASASKNSNSTFTLKSKADPVQPLWSGTASDAMSSWSRLESRRKAKRGMLTHLASGFKSMVGSSQSDDESSPPATPVSPPLVVRPGEGIFCEWTVKRFNEYFDMADPSVGATEEVVDPAIAKELAKRKEGKAISLDDCLDEFSKEETLGQDDLWYCPQCKKHQAATKKLEIYQSPDILVICIKRFGSSRRLSDKLDHLVSFPMEGLDLSDRIDERKIAQSLQLSEDEAAEYGFQSGGEPIVYDLYAVDNHFGGMGGGHYTAFCRNKVDGDWYNYDDSRVSKANPESVQSRAAYLLFYRRRTSRPIGGISRIKAEEASRAASRVVSPAPSSPELEPEAEPTSHAITRASSGDTSSTDPIPSGTASVAWPPQDRQTLDVELPPYTAGSSPANTPPPASPTVSSPGGDDNRGTDFSGIGQQLGFGNTAWGVTAPKKSAGYGFGVRSIASTEASSIRPPTPTRSDDGFENVKMPETDSAGLQEGYEVVRRDDHEMDVDEKEGSSG